MENKIPYVEAADSARRASLRIEESEYKNFYEISDGGVLSNGGCAGELRLANDAYGVFDGTEARNVCEITRNYIACDASCLNTDVNGRVCVRIKE